MSVSAGWGRGPWPSAQHITASQLAARASASGPGDAVEPRLCAPRALFVGDDDAPCNINLQESSSLDNFQTESSTGVHADAAGCPGQGIGRQG